MKRVSTIAVALLLATGISAAAVAQSREVGANAAIRNNVQMKTSRDAALRPARLKERVSLGDDVVTASNSVLQILLLDRSSFTVGSNARMKIDRFVYDPARNSSSVGASVTRGAFRFMSGKATRGAPGQSSVNTPVATIGIRGTIFEGVVGEDAIRIARGEAGVGEFSPDPASALLVVLRGPGQATQGDEQPGAIDLTSESGVISLDRPGLALFFPGPGKSPIGPFAISDAGLALLHDLLRTKPHQQKRRRDINIEGNPVVDSLLECSGTADQAGGSSSAGCARGHN